MNTILNRKQRGLTMISGLILLILVASVIYILGFRVAPIYVEYFKIRKIIESVKEDVSVTTNPIEVQNLISRRFDIDYVNVIQARDLKVSKSRGKLVVRLKYEDSKPLFDKLYVVGKFDEVIQVAP